MKKYLVIISALLVGNLLVSCDDYLDVNDDPNNPTAITADLSLPVAQVFTAEYIKASRRTNHLGNMLMVNYSQTYGFSWYNDEFLYLVSSTFYDQLFDDAFDKALKQYQDVVSYGEGYEYYTAIGMIMKAFHFQYLVDIYGDVPYFEALQRSNEATPAYDDAEEIYDDMILQLAAAVELINTADAAGLSEEPGIDDVMFGGNMTMWKQFAHSLSVRMLTRLSDVKDAAYINSAMATITAEGSGFISTDVDINPGYLQEADKQNPLWEDFGWSVDGSTVTLTNDATCASEWIITMLQSASDPRIDYLYELPGTGHLGTPQGPTVDESFNADAVSNIGPGILKSATMSSTIFTLAEHNLNMAELALKGLGGMTAAEAPGFYTAGVQASFDYLGAGSSALYLASAASQPWGAGAGSDLESIITQKYFCLNGITAAQSWFDYSRTGFPSNLPVSTRASTSDRPVRLDYPASETANNAGEVPSTPNAFTTKIFWAN